MNIRKVAVGSNSNLKIRAVRQAFARLGLDVDILPYNADSGIDAQPIETEMMERGATNRALAVMKEYPDADLFIGIENGLVQKNGRWYDPACVVILSEDGSQGVAFGAHFPIPEWMVSRVVTEKSELGEVVKQLAGGGEKDPMKWLSNDTVPREELLSQAVLCAMAEILCPERYARPAETPLKPGRGLG